MQILESSAKPYELTSIHSDELDADLEHRGQFMNKDILFYAPGVGTYLTLSCLALLAVALIMYLNT